MTPLRCYRARAGRALDPAEAAPPRRPAYDDGTGQLLSGAVLLVGSAIAWLQPGVLFKGSVSQAHGICSGALGAFAEALNPSVAASCSEVSTVTVVIALAALAGAGLVGWGFYRLNKPKVA